MDVKIGLCHKNEEMLKVVTRRILESRRIKEVERLG
jgi:hypothetical protein